MSRELIVEQSDPLQYSIFDPTGNITALVESPVPVVRQPAVAAELMARHPEVEQVGFVRYADPAPTDGSAPAALRMAGGEFCGNAAMSAAALYLLRRGSEAVEPETVRLQVSGAAEPVEVRLSREDADCFRAAVRMPPAQAVEEKKLRFADLCGRLPLVRMEGISHIIVEPGSLFFPLLEDRAAAEGAVRAWCRELSADGLGLMFLMEDADGYRLTPLVYVPGSGTVFWENACASGSSAVGMALAVRTGKAVDLSLRQPGGLLRVESDPASGETWLYGRTRLVK
ncbi:MAG: hypothetical protein IJ179_00460 [Oscillospiraceae bacterium]|nr:hypothetical protein [Oscillospiraceae bacterium]